MVGHDPFVGSALKKKKEEVISESIKYECAWHGVGEMLKFCLGCVCVSPDAFYRSVKCTSG